MYIHSTVTHMDSFIQVHGNVELAALVMVAESYLHFNSLSHPISPNPHTLQGNPFRCNQLQAGGWQTLTLGLISRQNDQN